MARREAVSTPETTIPSPPATAAVPTGRLLGNGRFRTLLGDAGSGGAWLEGQALTAWRGDPVEDSDGWFVYLRDLENGAFWSIGERPVPVAPEAYEVQGGPGWMAIARRDDGIASRMEVWVDAELAAECRRVTLQNLSTRARRIELTSCMEPVLQDARHHQTHPGFSKLFVQTEFLAEQELLLARRRPREPGPRHAWVAHSARGAGSLSHESDRARFLGRGRGPEAPQVLVATAALPGTSGDVLDPILALRRVLEIAPGATARIDLALAAALSRDELLATSARLGRDGALDRSRIAAGVAAEARLAGLGLDAADGERLERLAAAVLYRDRALAAPGVSGAAVERLDLPGGPAITLHGAVVVVEAGTQAGTVAAVRTACDYWRALGLATTLVILAHERVVEAADDTARVGAEMLDAAGLARLRASADLWLADGMPSLARAEGAPSPPPGDLPPPGGRGATRPPAAVRRSPRRSPRVGGAPTSPWPFGDEPLRSFNGWGGFNARGDEYVIRLPQDASGRPRLTPQPWVNVLANPGFGSLISESGAGCTWSGNSRQFRITPWSNDPVRDPHDEALYLRDEDSGLLWSAFPGPIPGSGPYETRHGFGYTRCRHASAALELETEVFVHASDPVKIVRLWISNTGPAARRLSLVAYQQLVLGSSPEQAARTVTTWADEAQGTLYARTSGSPDHAGAVVFAAAVVPAGVPEVRIGADRAQILGPGGNPTRPAALLSGAGPDGRTGSGLEPCFCIQVRLDIGAGQERSCAFLLGDAAGVEIAEAIVRRLRRPDAVASAREEVVATWARRLGRLRIETPVESLDLIVNGWLAYQTLACRLWARTAFYQSGGAYGFRDQLQDAAAWLWLDRQITRDQILLHCAHQFVEGDVLHWWHPPRGRGIRTRFADDLLWLPYVTAGYVRATGDWGVLDECVPFLAARALAPSEDEAYLLPELGGEAADVYEHCCRALDRSLGTGAHGLPRFGCGDWNDGMNRVGREGRGESVWMAFFLHAVIEEFVPACERRGDAARAARLRTHQEQLREALEREGWDGGWYRRGYYDDGTPLGSHASEECRIDALVQAWAVLSGAAPRERCEQAMDAVARELVSEDGVVRLLAPPFDRTPQDPGYIKGYLPGVRENGGQYTHAALWVVAAMAKLGRREEAARLLEGLSPVRRGGTPAGEAVYQVEPYVVAADIYDNPQHRGRGGWTWYTGSAGWMLRVTLESLLGLTLEDGRTLVVRAAIPPSWPGYRLRLRPFGRPGAYVLTVRNTSTTSAQVVAVTVDGKAIAPERGTARVPITDDGRDHRIEIELG